ncbi:oxidosqualene:lanosterol cyclase [Plectosphaerella cucumerina]|uniref:Oxidosqualene:lanosterol cyclase n=1 Tax=Plectosphaerella cucumerina TaxID=40658 RepID=A0A8K0X6V1_9PEZI|nr:oxidosqualene:lanosterol cyclase [Plectosphaerella cucumerina]
MSSERVLSRKRVADAIAEQEWPKRPRILEKTDKARWRLNDDDGRHTWVYLQDDAAAAEKWPQTYADKYFLGLPLGLPDLPKPKTPLESATNCLTFFEKLQLEPGEWGCEYGGPMFLIPGMVITWYATKTPISDIRATEIKNYIFARANPETGGWGLHVEGESTAFGCTMNYTALRLLGVDPDEPIMAKARARLHELGGATNAPHWAKFWLAVLGVMKWEIVNPVPAELWLLPDWLPISPWRWWIHIRQLYLPMSFLAVRRWSCEETELTRSLRTELMVQNWETINWKAHRNDIAPGDNYYPKSWLLNTANWVLANVWEPYLRPKWLAERAEDWTSQLVDMEDANTDYANLAPVNAPMNTMVCYVRDGPGSYTVRRHLERLDEFFWMNAEGMLVNGTNGVQCWDTSFTILAIFAGGFQEDPRWRPMLEKALGFLDRHQIRENCKDQEKCYRMHRKGGWPFSNKDQGYCVSDCVSECIKSVILLQKTPGYPQLLEDQRIFDAIDTILMYQNEDTGGVGSYETRRGGKWLECLNAAEVFGDIMVEYDYPECTTACVTALSLFKKHWPDYRTDDIQHFIDRAVSWIKVHQMDHGGWYGSWGICFTYATMFAMESLASVGETYKNSSNAKRGCDFLISKQREDGGWSESYKSCETITYVEHPSGSLVVQTAWAILGLLEGEYPDVEPIEKGIRFLMSRQQPNGEWLAESIEGVFNKSCMITYPNYKLVWPIKALGMFARLYPDSAINVGRNSCLRFNLSYSGILTVRNLLPPSMSSDGQAGLALADAKDYAAALPKLNNALKNSTAPAWLLARAKCHIANKDFELALHDAEAAYISASARGSRPLMIDAQYRRAVSLYRLGHLADADVSAWRAMKLAEGVSVTDASLKDPTAETGGFWRPDREALLKQMKDVTAPSSATDMTTKRFGAIWNTAAAWRAQVISQLDKLGPEDEGRKITVPLVPVARKKEEPAAAPAVAAPVSSSQPEKPKEVRIDFFQSNTNVSVSVFAKGVPKDQFQAEFTTDKVRLSHIPGHEPWFEIPLYGQIDPDQSKYTVTPNKVELSLRKATIAKWPTLRADTGAPSPGTSAPVPVAAPKPAAPQPVQKPAETAPSYPTSSRKGAKNWDKVLENEDTDEKASVNDFFKNLYSGATEEQRRAMMKSFTESNGTSLSTNWDDVKDHKVETVPPEGVEAKKWT